LESAPTGSLLAALAQVPDPRGLQGRRHPLTAMLATVVCAILCGFRGYRAIAQWIALQEPDTWHWLGYKRKPPSANCFRDLLMALSPEQFETALRSWVGQLPEVRVTDNSLKATSIDGKTLCGTLQPHARAMHLLSALDHASGCVLSQTTVDQKTNEIKGAPVLLKDLVLKGRVIVGDAIFCQRELCQDILKQGGHYLFVVKENQPTLLRDAQAAFADEAAFSPLGPARIPGVAPDRRNAGKRTRSSGTAAFSHKHPSQ
jgi:hypothetical protein